MLNNSFQMPSVGRAFFIWAMKLIPNCWFVLKCVMGCINGKPWNKLSGTSQYSLVTCFGFAVAIGKGKLVQWVWFKTTYTHKQLSSSTWTSQSCRSNTTSNYVRTTDTSRFCFVYMFHVFDFSFHSLFAQNLLNLNKGTPPGLTSCHSHHWR